MTGSPVPSWQAGVRAALLSTDRARNIMNAALLKIPALAFAMAAGLLIPGCSPTRVEVPANGTVLCFGDSLTYGTGASPDQSYPSVLARITGLKVINGGVPGELSGEGRLRLPMLLQRYHPDVVVICHGGNDLLQKKPPAEIEANLAAMIEAAQSSGSRVILLGVPEPRLPPRCAALYRRLARRYRVPFDGKTLPDILSRGALKSDYIH
ncbi:MAG TPA: hypothetical protein ENG36_02615, partial [Lentisphaerae bacterium]|nr:hypothetical protein [Lentisphaerota bacterium]